MQNDPNPTGTKSLPPTSKLIKQKWRGYMKKIIFLIGTVLLSTTLIVGGVCASNATAARTERKDVVTKSMPTDYQRQAKEYVAEKYEEKLDNLWIVNESNVSLPYSKIELWECKIYFINNNDVKGNKNGYFVVINKADNTISEKLQTFLDEEEKAMAEICGKLDKYAYEKAISLKDDETLDVEIIYNNLDTKPLQEKLAKLDIKIIHSAENWNVVYATVTKKQLKTVEAMKDVAEINIFYGFPTEQ